MKDLKADQAGLSAHKKAAEGFREELDEAKEELEKIDDIIATADDKIAREREEARKFHEQMKEIEEIRTRQEEIQQQKEIASATAMSLRDGKCLFGFFNFICSISVRCLWLPVTGFIGFHDYLLFFAQPSEHLF